MKKNLFKVTALILSLVMMLGCLVACGEKAPASDDGATENEVYELTMSVHEPESSTQGTLMNWWCDMVEEKSNGRIKFIKYWGGSYASITQNADMLLDGSLDVSWVSPATYSGRFPISDVISLPGMGLNSAEHGAAVLWTMYENCDYLQEEYSDYYVVGFHSGGELPIGSTKKIESVKDIQGLRTRATAASIIAYWEACGGSPMVFPISDSYENLSKNVCDAVFNEVQALDATNVFEVMPYAMDFNGYRSFDAVLMCKATYEKLPADLQSVIDECSGMVASRFAGALWDSSSAEIREAAVQEYGTEFYEMPADVAELLNDPANNEAGWNAWREVVNGKGHDADQILADCQKYIAELSSEYPAK